jgi:hypothetical protein
MTQSHDPCDRGRLTTTTILFAIINIFARSTFITDLRLHFVESSVVEPESHHLVGAGAVTRCGSSSGSERSGSDNGIYHGKEFKMTQNVTV